MIQITITLLLMLASIASSATDTKLIVRVKARDGKFVGSSLGGAYVIIRDNGSQRILAEGATAGTTGITDVVMKPSRQRNDPYADSSAAKFEAVVNIDEPTFVRIEVVSPANHRQSQVHAVTELWLIPGKHIAGDGIILEVPGYIIDILSPRTHNYMPLAAVDGKPLLIQANIVLMCGCIITKNGFWNSEDIEVKAIVKRNGVWIEDVPLKIISANLFEGSMNPTSKGDYEFTVYAYNQTTGNTGVDKVNFVVY